MKNKLQKLLPENIELQILCLKTSLRNASPIKKTDRVIIIKAAEKIILNLFGLKNFFNFST